MESYYFPLLIDYWCNATGRYGLSFPFLVGAEQLVTGKDDFNITTLLEELKNSDSGYVLSFCDDLGEYIIGLHKREYPYMGQLKRYDGLIINNATLEELQSFGELDSFINDLYAEYIIEGNFSKNIDSGQWQYFTAEDLEVIETAKAT